MEVIATLPRLLHAFFQEWLTRQRGTSSHTVISYRDTWRLFLPHIAEPTVEQFAAAAQPGNPMSVPWIECEDASNALMFLVSDDARYITGAALPVDDGGMLT